MEELNKLETKAVKKENHFFHYTTALDIEFGNKTVTKPAVAKTFNHSLFKEQHLVKKNGSRKVEFPLWSAEEALKIIF